MRIVTYNLQHATRIDRALEVIREEPELRSADVVSLQEADSRAVERMASALEMHAAWYPAAIHPRTNRHFAPAVLSRWPLRSHRLIDLPYPGLHGLRRFAVLARIEPPSGGELDFVAVHFGTMREILPRQQEAQARAVLEAVNGTTGPLVVAGDLNRRGLGRIFEQAGFHWITRNIGLTHHIWSFDHVFARGFPAGPDRSGSVRAALKASDHRAVWAHFGPA
jgi:endonuclease/exonuclease/phosphatase family metal-dependent hydrolase